MGKIKVQIWEIMCLKIFRNPSRTKSRPEKVAAIKMLLTVRKTKDNVNKQ